MEYQHLLTEKQDHVLIVTLNRPEAKNAINRQMWTEMIDVFENFDNDPDDWVAVLTNAGNVFCAGADLKEVSTGQLYPPAGKEDWGFGGITQHFFSKPIIAAVNGMALGGGLELAIACDLVIATDDAKFGLPEVSRGLIPSGGGLLRLPRMIPLKFALEAVYTAERISAEQALSWGLINHAVPAAELMPKALEIANKICANAPFAVRCSKQVIYQSLDSTITFPGAAWEINDKYTALNAQSEDAKEGPTAFAQKRKPDWKGR